MSAAASKHNNKDPPTRTTPIACQDIPAISSNKSAYPAQFLSAVKGRTKRKMGNLFGLRNFGINHTTLAPGASSALQHHHTQQDECVVILEGTATLCLGDAKHMMNAGDCMGFPAGQGVGHAILNESKTETVVYLEVGDRTADDQVEYPKEDLRAIPGTAPGTWQFTHKDGTPYE